MKRKFSEARSLSVSARWASKTDEEKAAWAERSRINATKQMAQPGAREHISRMVKEAHRREGYRKRFDMTPEIAAKISAAQKGKPREWTKDKEKLDAALEKIADKSRGRFERLGLDEHELFRPDVRERALRNSAEEGKTNPLRGRFETNCAAEDWHLMSPDGAEYHFRNLRHFIRIHRHLFSGRQLEEVGSGGKTRAETCLCSLSPRNKRRTICSQGWTWNDESDITED